MLCIYASLLVIATLLSACKDDSSERFSWVSFLSNPHRFKAYKTPSSSMAPAILPGERILVDRQYYRDRKPERRDILVFEYPEDPTKDWLKRVIAIEKDVIKGESGKIYVNGQELEEPYVQHTKKQKIKVMDDFGPVTVPRGTLFVMGDSRDESVDSRYFGVVSVEKVKRKVVTIYWSHKWSRIGTKAK